MMISTCVRHFAISFALVTTGPAFAQDAGAQARPDAVEITQTETHYVVSAPVSRLVMRLPKGTMAIRDPAAIGAASNPRYFLFEDRDTALLVSGWFEPQQRFAGLQKFWADEVARRDKKLPTPQNVVLAKKGGWETVAYDIPVPRFNNTHLRAHWVQAGTWIDLHLSLTSLQAVPVIRARLLALLAGVNVSEKK